MLKTPFFLLGAGLFLTTNEAWAQAPPDAAAPTTYHSWPLVVGLQFHRLALPFSDWKSPLTNVGVSVGTEFGYNRSGTLVQSVQVGYYHNRNAGDGLFITPQLIYRPQFGPLFAEVKAGVGALYTFHPSAALELRDGAWQSSQHQGTLTLMVPVGVSIGYSGRDKSPLLAPFVSYEVFLMHGYNASVPLLPHRLLQVGVRSHFTRR